MMIQSLFNKSINKSLELLLLITTQLKSGKRKKCLVYGNCQSPIISRILCANPVFSLNYEIVKFKPVFKIEKSDLEDLKTILQEIDLFIYQPVKSGYRGLEELGTDYIKNLLKPQALSISFHSLYFNSYNPEIIYISKPNAIDDDRVFVSPFGDYHNKNIIDMFIRGCQVKDVIKFLSDPEALDRLSIQEDLKSSIDELERRECEFGIDVKIASYIRHNYQLKRLFWTKNHPSNDILFYCASNILERLGFLDNKNILMKRLIATEFLDGTYFSIHPAIYRALELSFHNPKFYFFKENQISLDDAVSMFFNFYDENPQVIAAYLKNCK
ncbi:MAG: hypothetical protein RLZZ184_1905 [Cyanobacteriota bacterium]|jgi:hypothetical protein